MDVSPGGDYRSVLFVDTNALHYMRLALRIVPPPGTELLEMDAPALTASVREKYPGARLAGATVVGGWRLLRKLRQRCSDGATIMYSPVSRLELTTGGLRGAATLSAANESTPERWWSRIEEGEILSRLASGDYTNVRLRLDALEEDLRNAGIVLQLPRWDQLTGVWDLANLVLTHVYVEAADCLIYASALLLEADGIFSADGYVRYVINAIHNPHTLSASNQEQYVIAQTAIREYLAGAIGTSVEEIRVPPAHWPH